MLIVKSCKCKSLLVLFRRLSFLAIACLLFGCGIGKVTYVTAPGAHHSHDGNGLKSSFVAPEASEIQIAGQAEGFSRPFEEVWAATLDVVSQYPGILAMNSTGLHRTLLAVKARESKSAPENRKRIATYGSFFEQMLGVAVIKKPDSEETEVAVAVVESGTGNLHNSSSSAQLLFSQIKIQLYNSKLWCDKFVYEKPQQSESKTKVEAEDFQNAANKQYEYFELEQVLGGWISKSMREELITVYAPEVTSWLDDIVDQLKTAAGVTDLKTRVTIIPANGLNAFALPNGNMLVSSGLLDSLDTTGQVASVLAHELDHMIQHDTIVRLQTKRIGARGAMGMRASLEVADMLVGIAGSLTQYGPVVDALWDLGRAAGRGLVEMGAKHLETALVSNYSAETELRADTNGMKLLARAGFDPETNITMLNTIKNFKGKELEKNEIVMFNLVNIRPGIDERIKNLEKSLTELKN